MPADDQVAGEEVGAGDAVGADGVDRVGLGLAVDGDDRDVADDQVADEGGGGAAAEVDDGVELLEEARAQGGDVGDDLAVRAGLVEEADQECVGAVGVGDDEPATAAGVRDGGLPLDVGAAADAAVEQAFGGEVGQSLAEGLGVDVEAVRERALAGELALELARGDGGAERAVQRWNL